MTARLSAQIPLDLVSTPSLEREDLVVSQSNALAVGAVDSWPDWPHPIVIVVGPPGAGKTHLAAAWARRSGAVAFDPSRPPASNGVPEPFAIVAEDIDRSSDDEASLFALMNAARLGGGFVLATSRIVPSSMPFELPDLRSRLRAATIVELGAPDEALLSGVLIKLAADRQIELDARLVSYALPRMERSLDAAADLIRRLDLEALASKERITRTLIQHTLAQMEVERATQS